jgi:DNA excision repair protein ERCC-4
MSGFALPALRSLGELADSSPKIIIDTREQNPLPFSRLKTVRGTLVSGDYSIVGLEELFAVERKTVPDLCACCIGENRSRFQRECHRLRGFRFKRLLIVGTEEEILRGDFQSNIRPKAVLGTLAAFEVRYDLPTVFCETSEKAGRLIERLAFYFAREMVCVVNEMRRATAAG